MSYLQDTVAVKVEKDDFCAQSRPLSCPPVGNSIFCPPSGHLHLNSPKSTGLADRHNLTDWPQRTTQYPRKLAKNIQRKEPLFLNGFLTIKLELRTTNISTKMCFILLSN